MKLRGRWPELIHSAIAFVTRRAARNYHDPHGPRHFWEPPPRERPPHAGEPLRVVSFNIEYALRVDAALEVLTEEPELRDADIVLLQEMDEASTRRIATALHMWFVYYPATLHEKWNRDFGNAVLSRWPIVEDAKVALPHISWYAGSHRTATGATIVVGEHRIRVYSTHLGTPVDIGGGARAEQLRTLLTDAERFPLVIIGGDMNSATVGRVAEDAGYDWPTRKGPRTMAIGRWDHVFVKGFVPGTCTSGTVMNVRDSSDHRPVWASVVLPEE